MKLSTSVTQLHRVGSVLSKRLASLKIKTISDLLYHFPFRYEDYSNLAPIESLKDGEQVTIKGVIEVIQSKRSPRKRTIITEAVVTDETDRLKVVWFGQPFISKQLKVGDTVFLSGKVTESIFGIQMSSPMYEKEQEEKETTHTARIVPIYPLTAGVTQKQLRLLIGQVQGITKDIDDWLPEAIQKQANVMSLDVAIQGIHFPETLEAQKQAEKRLKFDELFLLQLRAEKIRQAIQLSSAVSVPFNKEKASAFVSTLPFTLTDDQKRAAWEIIQDIEKSIPMNRLLEGDVGSGKTVVAAMVTNGVIEAGGQVLFMAPTEILAKQHFSSMKKLLGDKTIAIFTRTAQELSDYVWEEKISKKKKKEDIIQKINNGEVDLIIGTHALLTDKIQCKSLHLVIVDEQHRFGVEQRKSMKDRSGDENTTPHFLSMSATPIPRSFALTIYGDLDLSIIKQMPEGRRPVKTRVADPHNRQKAYTFIDEQIQKGRQIFVICPLIQEGKVASEKKTVLDEHKKLSEQIFKHRRVGYMHGKMKASDKDDVMNQFQKGDIDILVSTSVVEVGVNIPNASVMVIEGAESFGLAQLHQFRGRVGRSIHQSYCFLFTTAENEHAKKRLSFFEQHTDGFKVAEHDLLLRGPGEVYGVNQSGMEQFRLASMKDGDLIKKARDIAKGVDFQKHPSLDEHMKEWEEKVHLE
ncbi:MAG: ATP-dependent DNA helicase RecG [Candidatus Magasanikbacteria bacterium]|jgi:ATP-dependent DNA helicase RecG|nr:ATP-dependent DNA helicase RecG [Candidatus Magasanikbacteria bacterium]MBT4221518.1 ATP-dependent DNA helicase RecG [Candidatus Magasanikbacteria bacterium]MBT4350469.1 ATP-dependent DNA helicase RecG [Candidatus Magasanikbacteria bacterium]MBT4541856.1 ATP-dependent DNA helicase RecG [Candidatus Magasanikbacteria bacterium]MBT6253119.1 ATP-dependent DNA helicase RecG [Candidatus Magasanikbacteria bacterium]